FRRHKQCDSLIGLRSLPPWRARAGMLFSIFLWELLRRSDLTRSWGSSRGRTLAKPPATQHVSLSETPKIGFGFIKHAYYVGDVLLRTCNARREVQVRNRRTELLDPFEAFVGKYPALGGHATFHVDLDLTRFR